jgi:hypothetical protein
LAGDAKAEAGVTSCLVALAATPNQAAIALKGPPANDQALGGAKGRGDDFPTDKCVQSPLARRDEAPADWSNKGIQAELNIAITKQSAYRVRNPILSRQIHDRVL